MRLFGIVAALTLSLVLAGSASAADKAKKAKKTKPVNGTITAVKKDQDKDSGTLTIKTAAKKGATATETTVTITGATRFEKFTGKNFKKGTSAGAAKFSEVATGEQVAITLKDNKAEQVKFLEAKKKKAKK